jgi:redox-sensitive bicupin YhaK (pirin superfamily)
MIVLRRTDERRHERSGKQETWLTFDPQGQRQPFATRFGDLEILTERWLPPKATVRHPHPGVEIVTYVHEGALAYEDSAGQSMVLHAGEFRRLTADCGSRRDENNASRVEWARVFEVGLRPTEGCELGLEQKRFSVAERRGGLRLIGSLDGDKGSLHIHQDAQIYSAILERGQHAVHELVGARSAWLHVIRGEVQLGDTVLVTGDGAGIATERSVSFTARLDAEVLLVDLRQAVPLPL